MNKFKYIAFIGRKFRVNEFDDAVELRQDHRDVLQGEVRYLDPYHLTIETGLSYELGQGVSIGGYPQGGKNFLLDELSITNNPVILGAKIIEKEKIE